jgi:4'-phosphopantetheinyl transferase
MTELASVYWLTGNADNVPGDSGWLTVRERGILEDLRYIKRRADWRLGRWTAKRAVLALLSRSGFAATAADVEIIAADDGAPELYVSGDRHDCAISISHSRGIGFVALSPDGTEVGCDVETVETRGKRFVDDYFTEKEIAAVSGVSEAERPVLTTLTWSAKESALKAARVGLGRDTRSMEVRLPSCHEVSGGRWNQLSIQCSETKRSYCGWWMLTGQMLFTISCRSETGPPSRLD